MPDGVYPTGHNYSNFIVKAATCTQDGERRFVCDKCGDEYTEVIPATGHSYTITDSSSESGVTTRVYTCMLCGDSYTQELGDQYEEVSSYIEELRRAIRTVSPLYVVGASRHGGCLEYCDGCVLCDCAEE